MSYYRKNCITFFGKNQLLYNVCIESFVLQSTADLTISPVKSMPGVPEENKPWYHGSPWQLVTLLSGSTVTQDRRLAEVFSHKPSLVCDWGDGRIQHNGSLPGFLYAIAEPLQPGDLYPHPLSSMEPGKEWLTRRELRLVLIGPVDITEEELITEQEIARLKGEAD